MFVMSVKMKSGRVQVAVGLVAAMLLVALLLFCGGGEAVATGTSATDDAGRRQFLQQLGYEVAADEALVREVTIPAQPDEAYTAYQQIQQQAGYDLEPYRGKRVKCWQYAVINHPGDPETVAHLYVYKDKIIGGDLSSIAGEGFCHGLTAPEEKNGRPETKYGTIG